MSKVISLSDAADLVDDGCRIALGGGGALMRRPMAFARALIRREARELHVHQFLGGIELDLLVAAGAVRSTNCAYVGLLEHGQAPSFQHAVRAGLIDVREYSEFSFMASLRAADFGLPFIPSKTPWGSDIVETLGIKTIKDPYSGAELLALPAMTLDVAVIHAERADEDGFVEAPPVPDLIWDYDYLIARVASTTIVCVEEIAPPRDPACVSIVGREVSYVVECPGGAWPTGLTGRYEPDFAHVLGEYLPAAEAGGEQMHRYLSAHLDDPRGGGRVV